MSEYRSKLTGSIYDESMLCNDFIDMVLPQVLDKDTLTMLGYDPIMDSPMPDIGINQGVIRDGVSQDSKGNWVKSWKVFDLDAETITEREQQAIAMAREAAKQEREKAVASILVDVDGMTFDGDEISQGRMARAILALTYAGQDATLWILHDNTQATVTVLQLRQALMKAGMAQTAMWPISVMSTE